MRARVSLVAAAVALAILTSQADAQLRQPASVSTTSFNYTYYLQDEGENGSVEPSPSDIEIPEDPADSVAETVVDEHMLDDADLAEMDEGEDDCEDEGGPIRLFDNCCCCLDIGGWINGGVYANADGVTSGTGNLPVGFTSHSDGFMLNQAWIYFEKALPEDCCCHGWGGRVDYVFGTDGPDTWAFGDVEWDNNWDTGRDYGSAIPQAYVEYGNADFNIRAGHFYTIIGYEVVTAPDNFFYSHAYTMLYAEPFTHTGVLVSKTLSDQVSVTGGWTQGWDGGFINRDNSGMFLGSISWTSCDETLAVTYAVTTGDYGDGTVDNVGDVYMHSVVATYQINECMEYVFQSDYFDNTNRNGADDVTCYGVNQYLFYTLSDCCKLGVRGEWFSDDNGANSRVAVADAATYNGGDFYAVTVGLNYTPNDNVIVRPEIRHDWYEGDAASMPFGDGTAQEMTYYGFDVIVLY